MPRVFTLALIYSRVGDFRFRDEGVLRSFVNVCVCLLLLFVYYRRESFFRFLSLAVCGLYVTDGTDVYV